MIKRGKDDMELIIGLSKTLFREVNSIAFMGREVWFQITKKLEVYRDIWFLSGKLFKTRNSLLMIFLTMNSYFTVPNKFHSNLLLLPNKVRFITSFQTCAFFPRITCSLFAFSLAFSLAFSVPNAIKA